MDEGNYDIFGKTKIANEKSSLNGERIATFRSLVSVYERRFKRFQEEHKLLSELIESQYDLISKLGITPDNMILSPTEIQKTDTSEINKSIDDSVEKEEIENNHRKNNSPNQHENFSPSSMNSESFLNIFQEEMKKKDNFNSMHQIFQKFPIFESAFFSKDFAFNIQPICEYIQTLTQEKRQEFYSEIWISLNNLHYFFNSLFSLIESDSFHLLSELVESTLPHSLNYSHIILYSYDSKKSLLTIDKQKIKISHELKDGLISNSIKNNQPIFIDRNDPNIKFDDLNIMVKHEKALFIPINDISIVLAFFDKIGELTPIDNLISISAASMINEISHGLQLQAKANEISSSFQQMAEIFIELSSICNINDFLNTMTKSLTKVFDCSELCFFEVSQTSNSFWRFNPDDSVKSNQFKIGHGIVGYSIAKKSSISLSLPEFSILFDKDSDRPEKNFKINSILTCPVFDDKGEVRWSIALFNKSNSDNFSQEDVSCIEIFANRLHQIIESVLHTSKNSNEIENSNQSIENSDQIADFILCLSNLDEFDEISTQMTQKMKENAIASTEIYTINRRLNFVVNSSNRNDVYFKKIEVNSDDPIINICQENQTNVINNDSLKKIFCPLIGSSKKVIGLMVLNSNDKRKKRILKVSKLQKKLAAFNQNKNQILPSISNSETSKDFKMLTKIVGRLVEIANENKKVKQLILIQERMIDSILSLDKRTIAYLYPQIELNFMTKTKNKEEKETKPVACLNMNDDLINNFISLISLLNQFPGSCKFLSMKKSNQTDKESFNESLNTEFPVSNSFNVFQLNEKQISFSLIVLMEEIGIVSYFNFDRNQIQSCIECIRNLHVNKSFSNWQLSIDRIQFLNYFLKQTNLHQKFTECQKLALFFYLISMNCDPMIYNDVDSNISLTKSKYYLEYGSSFNNGTTVFTILSSIPDSSFFSIKKEDQNLFFKTIESLDQINDIDSSLTSDLVVLTALICSFSYLARDFEISQKWIKLRFDEEFADEDSECIEDLIKYQLDFELKVMIQPAFGEFTKNSISIDEIRNHFTECLSKFTSSDL